MFFLRNTRIDVSLWERIPSTPDDWGKGEIALNSSDHAGTPFSLSCSMQNVLVSYIMAAVLALS